MCHLTKDMVNKWCGGEHIPRKLGQQSGNGSRKGAALCKGIGPWEHYDSMDKQIQQMPCSRIALREISINDSCLRRP